MDEKQKVRERVYRYRKRHPDRVLKSRIKTRLWRRDIEIKRKAEWYKENRESEIKKAREYRENNKKYIQLRDRIRKRFEISIPFEKIKQNYNKIMEYEEEWQKQAKLNKF